MEEGIIVPQKSTSSNDNKNEEREHDLRRSKELPSKKMENRRNVFELAEMFPQIHIDQIIATVSEFEIDYFTKFEKKFDYF